LRIGRTAVICRSCDPSRDRRSIGGPPQRSPPSHFVRRSSGSKPTLADESGHSKGQLSELPEDLPLSPKPRHVHQAVPTYAHSPQESLCARTRRAYGAYAGINPTTRQAGSTDLNGLGLEAMGRQKSHPKPAEPSAAHFLLLGKVATDINLPHKERRKAGRRAPERHEQRGPTAPPPAGLRDHTSVGLGRLQSSDEWMRVRKACRAAPSQPDRTKKESQLGNTALVWPPLIVSRGNGSATTPGKGEEPKRDLEAANARRSTEGRSAAPHMKLL
jgi:hypothetical protein